MYINCICRDLKIFNCISLLYVTLLWSVLEYGSLIWNPYYDTHINSLEMIQNKYAKFLDYNLKKNYILTQGTIYLRNNWICKLSNCRRHIGMFFLNDILQNRIKSPDLLSLCDSQNPKHQYKKFTPFLCSLPAIQLHQKPTYLNRAMTDCNLYILW